MSCFRKVRSRIVLIALCAFAFTAVTTSASQAAVQGAIFTTDVNCTSVNLNVTYANKQAVYLDGGPAHPGAAGISPTGNYYVQVTSPQGTLLGTSVGSANPTPVTVNADGEFAQCYQLWSIVFKASDGTQGFDDTDNNGNEYKVWISTDPLFANSDTKTDNFKAFGEAPCTEDCGGGGGQSATLNVRKFYDANANGLDDDGQDINGWLFDVTDGSVFSGLFTPQSLLVTPDTYTVTEGTPVETNWLHTTPNPVVVTVADGETANVAFGNVCLGAGGGLTLGFWSNKNGQRLFTDNGDDLALMNTLNLRNANGTDATFASYTAFRTWLLSANATNMAYMLSAQLAAMELNVANGKVSGSSLVYSPVLGFVTVNALMSAANTELGLHGNTTSGSADAAFRPYQEALKNALDQANNNQNFVQGTPCAFSFATS